MKNLALILLFMAPFAISAQEPAKDSKSGNTPPSTQKGISEKGIKGRGLTPKKSADESTPAPPASTTEDQKVEQTPQEDPKTKDKTKDKKDPKSGTTTEKAISEKGVSSNKKKRSVSKSKDSSAPANTTVTATPKN